MAPVKRQPHARRKTFLRDWRLHRGMSLESAAEKIGVDHSTLQRIEVGKSPYSQDTLEKLALVYMCSEADLIATDPANIDALMTVVQQLRQAPAGLQKQAAAVVEAILKTGS